MRQQTEPERTIPTIFGTLKAGFEFTTQHGWLVILPFLLNTLLWVGPRVLVADLVLGNPAFAEQLELATAMQPEGSAEIVTTFIERFNLLTLISVPLIGVPTLYSGIMPDTVPLTPATYQLVDWGGVALNILALLAVGMVMSALFYSLLTRLLADAVVDWEDFGRNLFRTIMQLAVMFVVILIVLFLFSIPLSIMAVVSSLINPGIGVIILLMGSVLLMWAIIFFSFSLPTLFFHDGSPARAILNSVRFLQANITTALPLLMLLFLIRSLTNSLWLSADDGSWLTLVSIAGHAFVATALTASLFIFYRDRAVRTVAPQSAVNSMQ